VIPPPKVICFVPRWLASGGIEMTTHDFVDDLDDIQAAVLLLEREFFLSFWATPLRSWAMSLVRMRRNGVWRMVEDAMVVFSAGHNQNLLELTLFSSLLLSASLSPMSQCID
jgi:hypothetical protein